MRYVRYVQREGLNYDPSYDRVLLDERYIDVSPVVAVKEIIVGSGARCGGDLYATRNVDIYTSGIVVGNIYAEERVRIFSKKGPQNWGAIVVGDVFTSEFLTTATDKPSDYPAIIYGNVIAEKATITAPLLIRGNLLVKTELTVTAPTFVLGRTRVGYGETALGKAQVKNFGTIHLYVTGDLLIGPGVTTVMPIIAARKGSLKLTANKIRVFNIPCLTCGVRDPAMCKKYLDGTCDLFDFLLPDDYATWSDREFVAWYWRATPRMILQHFIANKIYKSSLKRLRSPTIESSTISGVRFEDFYEYILREVFRFTTSREDLDNWLKTSFEDYLKEKNIKPVFCPNCGFPNLPSKKIVCIKCGEVFEVGEEVLGREESEKEEVEEEEHEEREKAPEEETYEELLSELEEEPEEYSEETPESDTEKEMAGDESEISDEDDTGSMEDSSGVS